MIHRYYNPWHITNSGEREADKNLILPPAWKDKPIAVQHNVRICSRFHNTQAAGECDFIIYTSLGILILEVKGGIIGYGDCGNGNNEFYRIVEGDQKEKIKNPFTQADANADAIKNYLVQKGCMDVFVGSAVCFPECVFDHQSVEFNNLWHRGHQSGLVEMILDTLQAQIADHYEKQKGKNSVLSIQWKELSVQEIVEMPTMLKPEFKTDVYLSHTKLNISESERRLEEGVHILRGLDENQRIMVQGPPGSGKSTYAFDIISRKSVNQNQKGLYLCWNEFLAARMRQKVMELNADTGHDNTKACSYFNFITELALTLGDKSLLPNYDIVSIGDMRKLVKDCLEKLHKAKKLPKFDFIIVDEAQDLFDKGIDLLFKYHLNPENALENGSYYIFYDDSQAFPKAKDLKAYIQTRDALKKHCACYSLFSNLRVNTGLGLTDLISDAGSGHVDFSRSYGDGVVMRKWEKQEEILPVLKQFINQETLLGRLTPHDMVILFTADLLKENSPFLPLLKEEQQYEVLNCDNLNAITSKIHCSTALKVKGLEWNVVFLICSSITDKKNLFQLFIAASRAKVKVYIIHC